MKKLYRLIFILLAAALLASCGDDQKAKNDQAEIKQAIDSSGLKDKPIAKELEAYVITNKVPANEAMDMAKDIQAIRWTDKPLEAYLKARATALQAGYKNYKDYSTGKVVYEYPNAESYYQMRDLVDKSRNLSFPEYSEILERLKQKNIDLSEAKSLLKKKDEEWRKLRDYCDFQVAIRLDKFRWGQESLPISLSKVAKSTELQIGVDGYLFDSGYDSFDKLGFVDGTPKKVIACEVNYTTTFMRAADERKSFEYKILYTSEEGNSDAEKYRNILTLAKGYESEIPQWMKKNGVKKLYSSYEFLLSGI